MKKIICITICLVWLTIMVFNVTYAEFIPVTKEKLEEAFENLKNSEDLTFNADVFVTDETISISNLSGNYLVMYDLTDKPTFWCEQEIDNTASNNKYSDFVTTLSMPLLLGYYPVTMIQGVDSEYIMSIIMSYITGYPSNSPDYNIASYDFNQSTLMSAISEMWKDKATKRDDEFNTYEWTIETKELTDTSCKVISKVVVNTDADFSKLEPIDIIQNKTNDGNSVETNQVNEDIKTEITNTNVSANTNVSTNTVNEVKKIPRSGKTTNNLIVLLYGLIAISIFGIIILFLKMHKENKEK